MTAPDPLRILHVIQTLDPRFGGPVSVVAGLASQQARDGHAVTLCTTDRGYPSSRPLLPADVADLGLDPAIRVLTFDVQQTATLFSWPMRGWLRRHVGDHDVVHVHCLYRAPGTLAARAARRAGVPYVVAPHGALNPDLYRQSAVNLPAKRLYERFVEWPNLRHAAALHFTTDAERDHVRTLGLGARAIVVPNGLDARRFAPEGRADHEGRDGPVGRVGALRDRMGMGDGPLLLFLGRINFIKGLDLLIPAFAEVVRRIPGARLALVGPDNDGYGTRVDCWIGDHGLQQAVSRFDRVAPDVAAAYYRDADVFVLPSYSENFGMSVAEALACGTPVVVTDRVNIQDTIAASGVGRVVPCAVPPMADALVELLTDRPRAQAMGRAGVALVRSTWDWATVSRRLVADYRDLISAGATG